MTDERGRCLSTGFHQHDEDPHRAGRERGRRRSNVATKPKPVSAQELKSVEGYMRKLFANKSIELRGRQKAADAAEVYVGGEFVGVISKDTEDGETCFNFSMSILDIDLEQG
jgi:hypothetical protein